MPWPGHWHFIIDPSWFSYMAYIESHKFRLRRGLGRQMKMTSGFLLVEITSFLRQFRFEVWGFLCDFWWDCSGCRSQNHAGLSPCKVPIQVFFPDYFRVFFLLFYLGITYIFWFSIKCMFCTYLLSLGF